jgi:hypothetical protein
MLRKTLLAVGTTAALAVIALAPTAASAHGFGHGHGFGFGHGHGFGFWGPGYVEAYDCYLVKKPTRYGYKLIQVCD